MAGKEIKATGNLDGLTEDFGLKGSFSFTGASNFFFFSLGNQPRKKKKSSSFLQAVSLDSESYFAGL